MNVIQSEDALLACIGRYFPNDHPHMLRGRGDDCCELACPPRMVLSTDLFMEDAHFRLNYFSPADIGHKALAVNISDIAAAGARPLGFSLGLMIPASLPEALLGEVFWEELFQAMAALADRYSIPLTGGDISRAATLGVCVSVWGAPHNGAPFLCRSDCRVGDAIFLIGHVGLARTGLLALESVGRKAAKSYPHAVRAHLRPIPLVQAGQRLAVLQQAMPTARITAMDLSDGLARDLPRLLAAGNGTTGASFILPEASLHPEVLRWAHAHHVAPAMHAFCGGEDYALLGTCAPEAVPALTHAFAEDPTSLLIMGTTRDNGIITVNNAPATVQGFDHFIG